jgi:hypothetical protein
LADADAHSEEIAIALGALAHDRLPTINYFNGYCLSRSYSCIDWRCKSKFGAQRVINQTPALCDIASPEYLTFLRIVYNSCTESTLLSLSDVSIFFITERAISSRVL